jgi:dolichol-phosphate mannosyltransferase
MAHLAAVVPVLNEEENVAELARRICSAFEQISPDYTLMFVDDGSTDRTWENLQKLAAAEQRISALRLSRNFGQHQAITEGLRMVDAEWTVIMDGDLQDRPELIPTLYGKAAEGYDVVFVERRNRPESWLYLAAQRTFYAVLRTLTDGTYNERRGNFSIISRRVLHQYQRFEEVNPFFGGLVQWLGFRHASIEADHGRRYGGRTSYTLARRVRFARNIILSFSTRPLDITLGIGLVVTVLALAFGAFTLLRALFFGYVVQGWASLMVSIYFLGGVQMVMIGMVGLYVGRIATEVKFRPPAVVAEQIGGTDRHPS